MKVSKELYRELVNGLRETVEAHGTDAILAYKGEVAKEPRFQPGGPGDLEMRFRWDMLAAWRTLQRRRDPERYQALLEERKLWTERCYDAGCVDAHIDTVLKKAVKELGLTEEK